MPMTKDELIAQLCMDLNQAHDELMKAHGVKKPSQTDWPEWTPQANSIREAERTLTRRLARTDAWTLYPTQTGPGEEPILAGKEFQDNIDRLN